MVGDAQLDVLAVVEALALLFVVTGSLSVAVTLAVLIFVPALVAVAMMVMVALLPLEMPPSAQMTFGVPEQLPCDGVAETSEVPAGSGSATVTFVAATGPLFVTVIEYVMFWPTVTVGVALLLIATSGAKASVRTSDADSA